MSDTKSDSPEASDRAETLLRELAATMEIAGLLAELDRRGLPYEPIDHRQQGEFHHDYLFRLREPSQVGLDADILVAATNCNGGLKELFLFERPPEHAALWHSRCPDIPDFTGELPPLAAQVKTPHWVEPCSLLEPEARSEYRPEHRRRQTGGGWEPVG